MELEKATGNKGGVATSYNNIGNVYSEKGNYEEALKNYYAGLKIEEEIGRKGYIARFYHNIAQIDSRKGRHVEALEKYFISLKMKEEIDDQDGIALSYGGLGYAYMRSKQYGQAEKYFRKGEVLAKKIGGVDILRSIYNGLSNLGEATGNYKGAYQNHKLYILYRDSLDNEQTRKKTIQSQMTYDFEKKEAVADAEHKKELENQELIAGERSRKQKIVILFVVSGLFLVLVFAGFIFRSLRVTRKQKNIIESQKELVEEQKKEVELQKNIVEEHQKEIIDSITYARRIQLSLLPTEKYIEKTMKRLNSKN